MGGDPIIKALSGQIIRQSFSLVTTLWVHSDWQGNRIEAVASNNGLWPMSLPLVFGDGFVCGPDLMRIVDESHHYETDRRRRVRIALAWTIYLVRPHDARTIESRTKNISSEGFYCLVQEPFRVGESIRCVIVIPACDGEEPERLISLECQVRVLRLETVGSLYGMACHIEDYRVAS